MKTNNLPIDLVSFNKEQVWTSCIANSISLLKSYDQFAHKGTRGHAAIVAGSTGMMGAAILATQAALRSGVGKVTLIVGEEHFPLIHASAPEALVCKPTELEERIHSFNAIGVGPGLGNTTSTQILLKHLFSFKIPVLLDADAINVVSADPNLLASIPKGSLFTPHRLEAERLVGEIKDDKILIDALYKLCKSLNINILLKSHFSILITPSSDLFVNGTGNSGMGKAGSGDVLTGLITGLAAQGLDWTEAARLGACIHGLAGDFAKENIGEDAMCAGDQLQFLSKAFKMLRNRT